MTDPAPTPRTSPPGGGTTLAGRPVARIGFGAMQLEQASDDRAVAVLRHAVDQGVNHVDTAQFYGAGRCNDLIRSALRPYPADLLLVSKVGAETGPEGRLVPGQRPEQLRAQVEANLAALGVDQLAVVNLRRMDTRPGLVAEGDQRVDLDSQLAELTALRDAGLIGAIGLSNVDAAQVEQSLPAGPVCVQNSFSLLDRSSEAVLELGRTNELAWVPFFPLGSAFPGVPKVTDHPAVAAAAQELGVTPAQVGLAWLLQHYGRTLLIPGTSDPEHLDENLAAGDVRLDAATVAVLDGLGRG